MSILIHFSISRISFSAWHVVIITFFFRINLKLFFKSNGKSKGLNGTFKLSLGDAHVRQQKSITFIREVRNVLFFGNYIGAQ